MKRITWEDFKTGNVVIHCDTMEKAFHFIIKCNSEGIYWYSRRANNPYKTEWEEYTSKTCYRYDKFTKTLLYSPLDFYEKEGCYEIYNYEIDLIEDEVESSKELETISYDDNLKNVRREYFTENPSCKGCLFGKESLTGIIDETSCEVKFETVKNTDAESCKYYKVKF